MITVLTKPQPNYRLKTRTRKAIIRHLDITDGKTKSWELATYPQSEDLITLEHLKKAYNFYEKGGYIKDYGKICQIDVQNKILCMEGEKEALIAEIKALRDKVEKLEGDRIQYAVDALSEAIIHLEM